MGKGLQSLVVSGTLMKLHPTSNAERQNSNLNLGLSSFEWARVCHPSIASFIASSVLTTKFTRTSQSQFKFRLRARTRRPPPTTTTTSLLILKQVPSHHG